MRVDLVEDVEWLESAFQEPATLAALAEAGTEMTPEQRKELDDAWPTMDPNAEPMAKVLTNAVSGRLQSLMGRHPWPREILLTDRFGQLVAATGRTSDFYQADEEWWQRAYRGGQGRLYVPPVGYDKSSDVWSVDLCIPVIRQGQVLGVCKVVRDVSGWMRSLGREVGGYPVSAMLVTRDGAIVYRAGTEPLTSTAEEWYGAITGGRGRGWRTTHGGVLQGYAWVALPRSLASLELDGQAWAVVLYLPKDEALGPIYGISLLVLTVGSILIGVIFLGGLWLVNRSIVRRVRRLAQATRRVAGGDLSHRLPAPPQGWRLLGRDEIDDLTEDFNTMLAQIQSSHEGLRSANQLKADFIRVAGHELRTPVS